MIEFCKLHDIELIEAEAPVIYGLFRYDNDYLSALRSQFPNSNYVVLGGCILDFNAIFYCRIMYCTKCREAHLLWTKLHNSQNGLAPSDEQHKAYIESLKRKIGYPAIIPPKALGLIENGQLNQAIKLLKVKNPKSSFSSIKAFVMAQHSKLSANNS
ncbi:hypothetical protein [Zooshikella ganghwensis]|uniref:hypothetical protein n=1 Tax=Zooshikella ganghwensis TaxID=202772 RepID=UPI00048389C7|nr:hypothetical protein [Zooshikella ganghwensis]